MVFVFYLLRNKLRNIQNSIFTCKTSYSKKERKKERYFFYLKKILQDVTFFPKQCSLQILQIFKNIYLRFVYNNTLICLAFPISDL